MSYHFLCKRGIRPARTEQFLVSVSLTGDGEASGISRSFRIIVGLLGYFFCVGVGEWGVGVGEWWFLLIGLLGTVPGWGWVSGGSCS